MIKIDGDCRIRDTVRDSKIRKDTPSKPYQKIDSFASEEDREDRVLDGWRHHLYYGNHQVGRDFPRTTQDGVAAAGFNIIKREGHQVMGFASSFDEVERWFHYYMEKEAPFLGIYRKNTESESIIVRFKRNLPSFDGFWDTDALLRWIVDIEDFFAEVRPPRHLKCKIVWSKMKGKAYYWWKQLQQERIDHGKEEIISWALMKKLVVSKFSPARCSTKLPNQIDKPEKSEEVKHSMVDDFVPSKCLTELTADTIESHSSKHVPIQADLSEHKFKVDEPLKDVVAKQDPDDITTVDDRDESAEVVATDLHLDNNRVELEISTTASHFLNECDFHAVTPANSVGLLLNSSQTKPMNEGTSRHPQLENKQRCIELPSLVEGLKNRAATKSICDGQIRELHERIYQQFAVFTRLLYVCQVIILNLVSQYIILLDNALSIMFDPGGERHQELTASVGHRQPEVVCVRNSPVVKLSLNSSSMCIRLRESGVFTWVVSDIVWYTEIVGMLVSERQKLTQRNVDPEVDNFSFRIDDLNIAKERYIAGWKPNVYGVNKHFLLLKYFPGAHVLSMMFLFDPGGCQITMKSGNFLSPIANIVFRKEYLNNVLHGSEQTNDDSSLAKVMSFQVDPSGVQRLTAMENFDFIILRFGVAIANASFMSSSFIKVNGFSDGDWNSGIMLKDKMAMRIVFLFYLWLGRCDGSVCSLMVISSGPTLFDELICSYIGPGDRRIVGALMATLQEDKSTRIIGRMLVQFDPGGVTTSLLVHFLHLHEISIMAFLKVCFSQGDWFIPLLCFDPSSHINFIDISGNIVVNLTCNLPMRWMYVQLVKNVKLLAKHTFPLVGVDILNFCEASSFMLEVCFPNIRVMFPLDETAMSYIAMATIVINEMSRCFQYTREWGIEVASQAGLTTHVFDPGGCWSIDELHSRCRCLLLVHIYLKMVKSHCGVVNLMSLVIYAPIMSEDIIKDKLVSGVENCCGLGLRLAEYCAIYGVKGTAMCEDRELPEQPSAISVVIPGISVGLYLTCGRVNLSEGWNDEVNGNTERRRLAVTKLSVLTLCTCLNILCYSEDFMKTLKVFYKLVNGLDPPKRYIGESGDVFAALDSSSYWIHACGQAFQVGGWR